MITNCGTIPDYERPVTARIPVGYQPIEIPVFVVGLSKPASVIQTPTGALLCPLRVKRTEREGR